MKQTHIEILILAFKDPTFRKKYIEGRDWKEITKNLQRIYNIYAIKILKQAEGDPLFNVDYIGERNWMRIEEKLRDVPEGACVSEFEHRCGEIKYEYHIHSNGTAKHLKRLYKNGFEGGMPWFKHLYSIRDLEEIVVRGKHEYPIRPQKVVVNF